MLEFNKNISISINLLNALSPQIPRRISDLSPLCETTTMMLNNVVKVLKASGLVKSVRSKERGLILNKTQISLLDVILAFYPDLDQSTDIPSKRVNKIYKKFLSAIPVIDTEANTLLDTLIVAEAQPTVTIETKEVVKDESWVEKELVEIKTIKAEEPDEEPSGEW